VSHKLTAPRGTADVLPAQAALRLRVEHAARELLESAGYGRIETPTFEATELFSRGVGEGTDIVEKEMYSFDDGGGRSLTLRPEGTAPVCRAYVEHGMHKLAAPVKLYYLESFFRAERPQAGRYRQFWQVGAEALGSEDPAVDAELIVLLHQLLARLGARGLHLKLSSLGTPAARGEYREELIAYLHAHEEGLSETVRNRIDQNPLRAFDADDPATRAVMTTAPRLLERLPPDDLEHFAEVRALLDGAGVPYEVDTTLVRGLDYYTRTVFEFVSDNLGGGGQSTVGAGGRYDGLVELLGGPPTSGVGWASGVERILLAAQAEPQAPTPPDLYIAHENARNEAFQLAIQARQAGFTTHLELAGRSLKGQLKHADRLNPRFVATVTPAGVVLRNRASGTEQPLSPADALQALSS
jgi:histidyl-tRNA synthetase